MLPLLLTPGKRALRPQLQVLRRLLVQTRAVQSLRAYPAKEWSSAIRPRSIPASTDSCALQDTVPVVRLAIYLQSTLVKTVNLSLCKYS